MQATLPGLHRANAFLPRFQPTFQCFRTLFCYITFYVSCTYLLQGMQIKKNMKDAKSRHANPSTARTCYRFIPPSSPHIFFVQQHLPSAAPIHHSNGM